MYAKIFAQIYDGTLCTHGPWQALVTFQQFLVLADQNGVVDMTANAISRRTTIPLDIIKQGIDALLLPDPESRTPTEEGRRIVSLSDGRGWGWRVVNYGHYRQLKREEDRREYHRQHWQKRKAKVANVDSTTQHELNNSQQIQPNQPIAYAEANAVNTVTQPDGFAEFYQAYPRKVAKVAAAKAFKGAKLNGNIAPLLANIEKRIACGEWKLDQKKFIPHPATYLKDRRWEDEAVSGTAPVQKAAWEGAR
jgi:hypothetical protein